MKPIGKPLAPPQILFASHRVQEKPTLQLGWKAGTEQYAPVELFEYTVLAEQAGFGPVARKSNSDDARALKPSPADQGFIDEHNP